ncbi:MAG: hypothetical protein M5U26_27360 [Planctomycetota bacterium]|nr:hypothetical protein [Planctomycetota bacterium]
MRRITPAELGSGTATNFPSGENAAGAARECWTAMRARSAPEGRSQSRSVSSSPPVSASFPSGETAT